VQGMGFFTTEEVIVNSDGILQSDGTWTYKIPSADSIPRDFRVELLQNALNEKGILSSKGKLTFRVNLSSCLFNFLRTFRQTWPF
jgi:xanthine dehydrogenase molybdopterin-binding subunit B